MWGSKTNVCVFLCLLALISMYPSLAMAVAEKQRAVLLSSFDEKKLPAPFSFFSKKLAECYKKKLERDFRNYFESRKYDVLVNHQANQYDLWSALHSPENVAVFWVSHSNFYQTKDGIYAQGFVVDDQGFDLKDIFREVHPNIKFLGVVGCKSHPVLDKILNSENIKKDNVGFSWVAFSGKTDARKGLRKAIRLSEPYLNQPVVLAGYHSSCPTKMGFPIVITRHFSDSDFIDYPPLRIENHGKILGVFPSAKPGEAQQVLEVFLPESVAETSPAQFQLIATAGSRGQQLKKKFDLGELKISASWAGAQWRLFADQNGVPFGVSIHIYQYEGLDVAVGKAVEYQGYVCKPMPPRELRGE